jgi:hypothetical protein
MAITKLCVPNYSQAELYFVKTTDQGLKFTNHKGEEREIKLTGKSLTINDTNRISANIGNKNSRIRTRIKDCFNTYIKLYPNTPKHDSPKEETKRPQDNLTTSKESATDRLKRIFAKGQPPPQNITNTEQQSETENIPLITLPPPRTFAELQAKISKNDNDLPKPPSSDYMP